jgi:PAS domain S-box-containing protein
MFLALRGILWLIVALLLTLHPGEVSPAQWWLAIIFLTSTVFFHFLPAKWFRDPRIGYSLFLLDTAGLTVMLYAVFGAATSLVLLYYLTVFMATVGGGLKNSVAAAVVVTALFIWLRLEAHASIFTDPGTLMNIPLFFAAAVSCGYLAEQTRVYREESLALKRAQKGLQSEILQSHADLAESEKLRAAAESMERRLRSLLEDIDAVIWEMEVPSLRFTFVSQQAELILGYPLQEWLSQPFFWQNHIHADDRVHILDVRRRAVEEMQDCDYEYRGLTAGGGSVWIHEFVHVVRDEGGKVSQLRGVMVDITERRQLEEEFHQAQKMEAVGRLAGGVAHDFNNLLTVINGYSELAAGELDENSSPGKFVQEVRNAGERAAALTRRLLSFSRRQVASPQVADLNELVASMEEMLRRLIGEDVELIIVKGRQLGKVNVDTTQIEQIIMNLAINSRDAMPKGGKVIIECANVDLDQHYADTHIAVKPGPMVMLAVSDTGVGMDAETQEHIFEPFFTTKERGKGTGLGLAMVYGAVKQNWGNIWVYSEPNKGTTFKIYLPRIGEIEKRAVPVVRSREKQARGSETVLLVEDEEGVRSFVYKILQSEGYKVLVAGRPDVALEICRQNEGVIHVLLTDVVMPQMNGRELAEKVLSQRPDTRVIYMSGYTDVAITHHRVLQAGVPFLEKPFTADALTRAVRDVIDAPRD